MKVIETLWFTNMNGTAGIAIVEEDNTGDRKAYIGAVSGKDEKADTESLLAWGTRLSLDTIERIMVTLDPRRQEKGELTVAEPNPRQIHFTSRVLGPKATLRLRLHKVTQTLRSANEVRDWGLPEGQVVEDSPFEVTLDGVVIGQTVAVAMTAVHWHDLDIEDARRGGFDNLFELEKALKRAGFRYKDVEDYGLYRIQFSWQPDSRIPSPAGAGEK